ncbi:MAG TPA: LPS export ABC transporter periplasmic protein LptC [Rhodothermales bacterium]|nr:LPS export ABC transporter periplasmic protein LptC [Rhodothermales bacterium]
MWRSPSRLLLLLSFLLACTGCERQATTAAVVVQDEDAPQREVYGVDYTISYEGRPRMHVRAPYMAEYEREDSTYTVLSGLPGGKPVVEDTGRVQVIIYDSEGALSATIWANRVAHGEGADRYEATGNVEVTTPEERHVESEHLAWYEASGRVRTPGFVKITTPTERIQGYELNADEDLSRYTLARITGQVTASE